LLILIGYSAFIFVTKDKMIGNMTINNDDCSYMEYEDIVAMLERDASIPEMNIIKGDETLSILDVSKYGKFTYPVSQIESINKEIPLYTRFLFFLYDFEKTIEPTVEVDEEALNQCLIDINGSEYPESAYVKFIDGSFQIIPETEGNVLDTEAATEVIKNAIKNNETIADVSNCYIKASVLSDNEELVTKCDELNEKFNFTITYDMPEDEKLVLDSEVICKFYKVDDNGIPYIDDDGNYVLEEDAIATYVKELAKKYDTIDKQYEFTTHSGEVITPENTTYGYEINQDKEIATLTENLVAMETVEREPVWKNTSYAYEEIGDTYVEVSKDEQHMWYYVNGEVVLESDVVTGNIGERETNSGLWHVMSKTNGLITGCRLTQTEKAYTTLLGAVSLVGIFIRRMVLMDV
jgi:hypothetical protein